MWAIVPVLVTAFVVLFGFPGQTRQLWAWTIAPAPTALFMGAGYVSGAYFFTRVAWSGRWHRAGPVFIAVAVFTALLLGATVLHWDRFNHDHVAFWWWLGLYATTPVLLPWLWARNRRTDPGDAVVGGEVRVPRPLRLAVGAGGAASLTVAVAMFVAPRRAGELWPWLLPPLSARAVSAFVAFAAMTWAWFLVEDRWSSLRLGQETVALAFALNLVGAVRAHDDFRTGPWFALYTGVLGIGLALSVALIAYMARQVGGPPQGDPSIPSARQKDVAQSA